MKTTFRILGLVSVLLLVWYLLADRLTPFTNNARVKAYVTQIVPQVSGVVTEINASNGQRVEAGEVLARIDRRPYEIALNKAKAELQEAVQQIGAGSAEVEAALAKVSRAKADLENTRLQTARTFEMERKGLVAAARGDDARAKLAEAESTLAGAEADLERAREQLGPQGEENPAVQKALAALAEAELNLEWTQIKAPAMGGVTNLGIAAGAYAAAGQPMMTFLDSQDVWIEAYMTENNLGNVRPGDRVEVVLDVHPGRILEGRVESFSAAASIGSDSADGLAAAPRTSGWMRDPQRFPLRIILPGYERGTADDDVLYQVNGQADVIVYTGENTILNTIGSWYIRLMSFLSYAY
ncbi:multidrug resistance efflux pump [Aliiruegeria haliotis]|uniref:Multidrug resistance efflux pump n=1 Tax=Aliiruegeria haliotis TaxID=1280846 RepID=A0A2T0RZG1_9RHOB|nr:HlyD family secretion protein [Aliiruegeria haliotis]PRY26557.1 multidrug resistance efflux pump [Aliiruegeria haliotis]